MSHSHICCLVHVVFSTAERRRLIPTELQSQLHAYMGGIARENGIGTPAIGGTANHIHVLLSLPRTMSVAKAVQLLKSGSSKWIHDTRPDLHWFGWQEGYAAFSIGISQKDRTMKYIESQPEHHKRVSFSDELEKFLTAHGMEQHLGTPE
jgi:REP element-mobilizing transposase RayT